MLKNRINKARASKTEKFSGAPSHERTLANLRGPSPQPYGRTKTKACHSEAFTTARSKNSEIRATAMFIRT
eukprot:3144133-Amphidinium_carterae.1